jgi:hypothetical protein
MKHIIIALFAAATFAVPAFAQAPDRDVDEVIADSRVKRMTTVLSLTDEQKGKVRPLVIEEIKKFKAIRQDTSLTEEDRIKKEKEFREANKPKFKAILSEEQLTKYEAMQSSRRVVKKPVDEKKKEEPK